MTLRAFDFFSAKGKPSTSTRPRHFCRKFILKLVMSLRSGCRVASGHRDKFKHCSVVLRPIRVNRSSTVVLRFGIVSPRSRTSLGTAIGDTLRRVHRGRCSTRLLTEKFQPSRVHTCKFTFRKGRILVKGWGYFLYIYVGENYRVEFVSWRYRN